VADSLSLSVELEPRLRERFFGEFENTADSNYARVWAEDERDEFHTAFGVESLRSVAKRLRPLLAELEGEAGPVLLVTHGDTSAVLRCLLTSTPLTAHRSLPPLAPAEVVPCFGGLQ
jgi:probable phosphoglycerate mutase